MCTGVFSVAKPPVTKVPGQMVGDREREKWPEPGGGSSGPAVPALGSAPCLEAHPRASGGGLEHSLLLWGPPADRVRGPCSCTGGHSHSEVQGLTGTGGPKRCCLADGFPVETNTAWPLGTPPPHPQCGNGLGPGASRPLPSQSGRGWGSSSALGSLRDPRSSERRAPPSAGSWGHSELGEHPQGTLWG